MIESILKLKGIKRKIPPNLDNAKTFRTVGGGKPPPGLEGRNAWCKSVPARRAFAAQGSIAKVPQGA